MDIREIIVFVGFVFIIIRYILDIRELIIHTKKRKIEIMTLPIITIVILRIMFKYANSIVHYILGILGIVVILLSVFRLGITPKGFKGRKRGAFTWTWDKISSVHIIIKNDVKIEYYKKDTSDIHIYKKEDYDRIMEILRENISYDKIKIQHK